MAVFAKSLGNGHPMAAIVGRAETMDAFHKSFISSAYWSEAVGPAAALAAVKKMKRIDVPSHLARMGQRYRDGLTSLAEKHNVPLTFTGHPGERVRRAGGGDREGRCRVPNRRSD